MAFALCFLFGFLAAGLEEDAGFLAAGFFAAGFFPEVDGFRCAGFVAGKMTRPLLYFCQKL
jgi:hypothetical protein